MMADLKINTPQGEADIAAIQALCWEYRDLLMTLGDQDRKIVETFYPVEKYRAVMARLGVDHVPPLGAMRLARLNDMPVGCGMVQTIAPGDAEIKRVFVNAAARGHGVGRALVQSLIDECRAMGFSRILMDTGVALRAATALYLDMGFRLRGPYQEMPAITEGRLIFFEMDL